MAGHAVSDAVTATRNELPTEFTTSPDTPGVPSTERGAAQAVGSTVIVDEAGMVATNDLHTLARLADTHQWNLFLVGHT